jgi:phosphatase NudJ
LSRDPVPTWYFALVIVRRGEQFLVVHERKHGQLWYLPAGRAEPGETLVAAAVRETREEAGIPIVVDGVVRIEHTPMPGGARVRAIFVARPADDTPLKSAPDDESLGAAWVTLADLDQLALRGPEVRTLFEHVARGGAVYPLAVLGHEGL